MLPRLVGHVLGHGLATSPQLPCRTLLVGASGKPGTEVPLTGNREEEADKKGENHHLGNQ